MGIIMTELNGGDASAIIQHSLSCTTPLVPRVLAQCRNLHLIPSDSFGRHCDQELYTEAQYRSSICCSRNQFPPLIQPYFDPRQLCCYSSHERVKYGGCQEDTKKRRRSTSDSEICQCSESVPSPQKVRPGASLSCRCNCTSNDLAQTLWARFRRQPPGVGKSKCWADLVSATRGQVVPDMILILVCKNTALLG